MVRLLFLVVGLVGTLLPAVAMAQAVEPLEPAVAAVIDYQRILRDAKAAQSIRNQVEARRKRYQDQIAREEQRLHEEDKALTKRRTILSAEAYAEKRQAFEADVGEVQRMVQERRRQLDDVSSEALSQVRNTLIEVVGDLAERAGFNVVLPSSGVLLFSPRIDLTEEVLTRLDAKLPDVKLSDASAD
ncbi:MAG: OmpH family outer membrane protein [Geminicoccaceae bacterium]|nr:OmpH family outer membrane protein [Geminicoccaceae bacterium]MCB9944643.1 OmpH family outer membrane protein [Geminicoccaceae bacterium]